MVRLLFSYGGVVAARKFWISLTTLLFVGGPLYAASDWALVWLLSRCT